MKLATTLLMIWLGAFAGVAAAAEAAYSGKADREAVRQILNPTPFLD